MDLTKILTIYGRKPVLEALEDTHLTPTRLHMAVSNKPGGIVKQIQDHAKNRGVDIQIHDRLALSRISKNGKQDQGVALDLYCPSFVGLDEYLVQTPAPASTKSILLDGITNPQNVGMIIRSCSAAGVGAIFYPRKSVAALGPLVIKASVGTLFSAPIVQCEDVLSTATRLQAAGHHIAVMDGNAKQSLFAFQPSKPTVFVLGGETAGASHSVKAMADTVLRIPMQNGVESLNVAMTAVLVAYQGHQH